MFDKKRHCTSSLSIYLLFHCNIFILLRIIAIICIKNYDIFNILQFRKHIYIY